MMIAPLCAVAQRLLFTSQPMDQSGTKNATHGVVAIKSISITADFNRLCGRCLDATTKFCQLEKYPQESSFIKGSLWVRPYLFVSKANKIGERKIQTTVNVLAAPKAGRGSNCRDNSNPDS